MAYGTGNNNFHFRDRQIVDAADLDPAIAPDATDEGATQRQPCLRDNECSQQQLVRLVGYRGPVPASTSWDRLRREQAALTPT